MTEDQWKEMLYRPNVEYAQPGQKLGRCGCKSCEGEGDVVRSTCDNCNGWGYTIIVADDTGEEE